jgi:patatin-like phospholipase/acyl hydrolase
MNPLRVLQHLPSRESLAFPEIGEKQEKVEDETTNREVSNNEKQDEGIQDLPQVAELEDAEVGVKQKNAETVPAILSIDAGGVRGILPARWLQEVEARAHHPVNELFDLFTGVSIGAMVSAGLLIPHPEDPTRPALRAEEICTLFKEQSISVFQQTLTQNVTTLYGHIGSKYNPAGLERLLERIAGDTLMTNLLGEFWCPACDSVRFKPIYFSRDEARRRKEWSGLKVADVLRATSAAPAYFPAKELILGDETYHLIDGAFAAYNPAAWGSLLARKHYHSKDAIILSLGTGRTDYSLEKHQSWGTLQWLPWLLDAAFANSSESVNDQLLFLSPSHYTYQRIQVNIPPEHAQLDDTRPENIAYLEETAKEWLETHEDDFNRMIEKLLANKGLT